MSTSDYIKHRTEVKARLFDMVGQANLEMTSADTTELLMYILGSYLDQGLDYCNKHYIKSHDYSLFEKMLRANYDYHCFELENSV